MPNEREQEIRTSNVSGDAGAVVQAGAISGGVHLHAAERPVTTPHELPPEAFGFTDRKEQLAQLDLLLGSSEEAHESAAVVISAVSGTAGVGKTAFVTHWAYRVRARFPDGELYANLHGYGPQPAVEPAEALAGFLRSLGVPNSDIPHDLDERAARFRSLVAGRRMLIVLDNARTAEQVRPLLPGTSSCLVLVTSRDNLPALVSREGARRVNLDLLPADQAVALLRTLIESRVDDEPEAVAALVRHCGRLPLALRIAAERALASPGSSLAELVDDLTDERGRLDLLDTGDDPYTAVRVVLSWSYGHLNPDVALAFRLLGLHPGRDFDSYAVAALLGRSTAQARRALQLLERAHLVEPMRSGRRQMHDLLRIYAADLAAEDEPETNRRAALTRLFDHYLHTAALAMDLTQPHERDRRPAPTASASPVPDLRTSDQAMAWLEVERTNLLAVAALAAGGDWPGYTSLLSGTIYRYLDMRSHFDDAVTLHTHAVAAARCYGDLVGEGRALHNLGSIYQRLGRYAEAREHLSQALTVAQQSDDLAGQGFALSDLGFVDWLLGRYEDAVDYQERALACFRERGDRTGQGQVLNNLALVYGRLGRFDNAVRALNDALVIFTDSNDTVRQGYAVNDLGVVYQRLNDPRNALARHQEALTLARNTGDRSLEAAALNGIGNATRMQRAVTEAVERHRQARTIAEEIGDRYEQAQAAEGLARAWEDTGNSAKARAHWQDALAIYLELGVPETDEVRRRLANHR